MNITPELMQTLKHNSVQKERFTSEIKVGEVIEVYILGKEQGEQTLFCKNNSGVKTLFYK